MEIEKNIPIPEAKKQKCKIPFAELQMGESILIEGKKRRDFGSVLANISKKTGFKFTSRITEKGLRVWRVPPG